MASTIFTNQSVQSLLTGAFDEVYLSRGKTLPTIYDKFLKVVDMSRGQDITYRMAGLGLHTKKGTLQPIDYDTPVFGESFTITPDDYAIGFRIAQTTQDDLAAAPYGDFSNAKLMGYKAIVEYMRDSATQTTESLSAQLILNANSTTQTATWMGAGRDGAALAGTHSTLRNPVISWSNNMTAAPFSAQQLQAALTSLETIPSDEGYVSVLPTSVNLVIGPYNRHRVYEILKTSSGLDTAASNVNPLNDFKFNVIVNPYLGSTFKGFAIFDPNRHRAHWYNRQDPKFESTTDFEIKGSKYSSMFRGKCGFIDAHGFIFNAGA